MDSYRIRVKVGPHEFEAEGPEGIVKEQFEVFRDLILKTPENATRQSIPEQSPPGQYRRGPPEEGSEGRHRRWA